MSSSRFPIASGSLCFPNGTPAFQRFSEIVIAEYDSSSYPVSKELFTLRKGKAYRHRFISLNTRRRSMLQDIKKILYHESTILSRLDELASEITEDYRGRDLTVVAVLNGSLVFMADLLRRIPIHLQLDCLSVSSYHGTKSAGQMSFRKGNFATFATATC